MRRRGKKMRQEREKEEGKTDPFAFFVSCVVFFVRVLAVALDVLCTAWPRETERKNR
jgi:hypothetical protein